MTLPDSAVGLLCLKCVLTHMAFKVMVSALEPDKFGRFYHKFGRGLGRSGDGGVSGHAQELGSALGGKESGEGWRGTRLGSK